MRAYNAGPKRDHLLTQKRERHHRTMQDPIVREAKRQHSSKYWERLRHDAFMAYGGYYCACCGETEPKFLSLDHINNDGAKHRRQYGKNTVGNGKGASGFHTWLWMKKNNYPSGIFQVLCMNCNMGKFRNGGACPHKATVSGKPRENGERPERITPWEAALSFGA